MQPIRMLAAVTGALVLGSACGGDNGPGPTENSPPVAGFSEVCTDLSCVFTDASTDPDGNNTITSRSWAFGDGATASTANPTHPYTAAGTYDVVLTVTDDQGATDDFTKAVMVTAGTPVNTPPTAGFTSSCNAGNCTFTNTSTDPDGNTTIASYAWNFGDPASGENNTSDLKDPTHSYTVTEVTGFTVTLTVTDDAGATDVETQTVTVSPPAGLQCEGVDCTLNLDSRSTIRITVTAADCQFTGNAFAITQPIQETVFTDGCSLTPGQFFDINGGAAFDAGTELAAQFTQGAGGPGAPPKGSAGTRVTGTFPDWTIEFDDGGNPTGPGEPDFNDIVLTVHATVVP